MHPKVFLSHASEDKGRFVLDFARQLRENGVDVWLDQWEMKPGDSLVDKIFDEGLKDASAVIIVLSCCAQVCTVEKMRSKNLSPRPDQLRWGSLRWP
jgi:hypothetical protein